MKNIILSYAVLVVGILIADIEILNEIFTEFGMAFLTKEIYIVPAFFFLVLLTIKGIYDVSLYTDETIPLKLGILSLVLGIIGFLVFYRVLLLGTFILIAATVWDRRVILSYYPPHLRKNVY